jgi:hypothetical protein
LEFFILLPFELLTQGSKHSALFVLLPLSIFELLVYGIELCPLLHSLSTERLNPTIELVMLFLLPLLNRFDIPTLAMEVFALLAQLCLGLVEILAAALEVVVRHLQVHLNLFKLPS